MTNGTYTLDGLAEAAGGALDALGVEVGNRRARQRPDARTVRYYTQHGLVDRPLPVGGREATYGPRHLAQVVAVKRLQAAGVSLTEIQRRLAGAADAELLAAIGPGAQRVLDLASERPVARSAPGGVRRRPGEPAARREQFWRAPAGGVDHAAGPSADVPGSTVTRVGSAAGGAHSDGETRVLVAIPLARGAELTIDATDTGVEPAALDAAELQAAAAPLLERLRALGVRTAAPDPTSRDEISDDEGTPR